MVAKNTLQSALDKICILTPARVTTSKRYNFTVASLNSLNSQVEQLGISHFVVYDRSVWAKFFPKWIIPLVPSLFWSKKSKEFYQRHRVACIEGVGTGSAQAMLVAVEAAITSGKVFGFIHLDDHVYCDPFSDLIKNGLEAMNKDQNLLWTRFSGYPIMYDVPNKLLRNKLGSVVFDEITLSPVREINYTLWSASITESLNKDRYWPIALWFCIYRLDFLKILLKWAIEDNRKHLAHVEEYFKANDGFYRVINQYPNGRFGYINMQFGGIEMHRNPRWQKLISEKNDPVL